MLYMDIFETQKHLWDKIYKEVKISFNWSFQSCQMKNSNKRLLCLFHVLKESYLINTNPFHFPWLYWYEISN
jgi:hypothetical protein